MDPPETIELDFHQDWEESLPNREEIIVRGLSLDGREGITCLLEEEGDRVGRHHKKFDCCFLCGLFGGGRAGAVKDCDDDDQSNCVGSSELGRFAEFGDTAERVRGSDGDGGAGSLVCIKLELDFHCREARRGDGSPGE